MDVFPDELELFAAKALTKSGSSEIQAKAIAEALVWNDQVGRDTQGVWRLPVLCDRLLCGGINTTPAPSISKQSGAIGVLDGDGASGHYSGRVATLHAIELAKVNKLGAVGVFGSNYFGSGAYFVHLCASNQLIGLAMSNSFPKVLPFNGARPALGTNPMAFGAPRKQGGHFLLDMATSEEAGSTIRKRAQREGAPPDDTAMHPLGGAKGFGLALMVEILTAVVTGAGISHEVMSMYQKPDRRGDNGHFFMALDIAAWMPLDLYYQRIDRLMDLVTAENPSVLIPGEKRYHNLDRCQTKGVRLDGPTTRSLHDLALKLNLAHEFEVLERT